MKLSIVIPFMGQHELTRLAAEWALANLSGEYDTELVLLDNVSETPFPYYNSEFPDGLKVPIRPPQNLLSGDGDVPNSTTVQYATVRIVRLEKPIGVYPVFWEALKHTTGDVIAFFHSDFIVAEKGWDKRVMKNFEMYPLLGLVGFIGSSEIDQAGGRGGNTTSNFLGCEYEAQNERGQKDKWTGSPAAAHGKHDNKDNPAAVVDGCSMIFRRSLLELIPQRKDFPPHHFYDRLLSCEVREKGYKIFTMGVECDHISGQTVSKENGYNLMAQQWCEAHGLAKLSPDDPWDSVVYREAEYKWLEEYRAKGFVPSKV